jgi:predicted  nucleic acid-binding Zn-ribbon protein
MISEVQGNLYAKANELAKSPNVYETHGNSTTAYSIHKNPSSTTFNTDQMRSNSFFSSFLLSERGKRSKSKHLVPTPQINIQNIIKKKADMYYDPSMAGNVDELLESGYNIVLDRKNQKKGLRSEEEELRENIGQLERDILPLMNRYFVLRDEVQNLRGQQVTFIDQAEKVHREIEKVHESIEARKAEIQQLDENYLRRIQNIKDEIEGIRMATLANRDLHAQELSTLKQEISANKEEKASAIQELNNLKAEYQKVKKSQGDKERKIENKTRMFLGLLKH